MCQQQDGRFFGLLFISGGTQAFELLDLEPNGDRLVLNYLVLGSTIEILYAGNWNPQQISAKFVEWGGKGQVPPFYAMGFWHGSNQFDKLDDAKAYQTQYQTLGVPLEGLVITAKYQKTPFETFTYSNAFKDLPGYVDVLFK